MTRDEKIAAGFGVAVTVAMLGMLIVLSLRHGDVRQEKAAKLVAPIDEGKTKAVISTGDEVDLEGYLRPDVRTVVEFTAEW